MRIIDGSSDVCSSDLADFKALVDAAHARGMKVYMYILINHTADVIEMAECDGYDCPYRSRADYPYSRRAADGAPINDGFAGDAVSSAENYARLADPNFARSDEHTSELQSLMRLSSAVFCLQN